MQWWKDFFNGVGFVVAAIVCLVIILFVPLYLTGTGHPLWGLVFFILFIMVFIGVMNAQEQKEKRKHQQKEK